MAQQNDTKAATPAAQANQGSQSNQAGQGGGDANQAGEQKSKPARQRSSSKSDELLKYVVADGKHDFGFGDVARKGEIVYMTKEEADRFPGKFTPIAHVERVQKVQKAQYEADEEANKEAAEEQEERDAEQAADSDRSKQAEENRQRQRAENMKKRREVRERLELNAHRKNDPAYTGLFDGQREDLNPNPGPANRPGTVGTTTAPGAGVGHS
jgi:hypothetical protein